MSKLTFLVFVIYLLACTYAAIRVNDDPIPIDAIPEKWYMIPVHPNTQGVSLYGDGVSTAIEDAENESYVWTILGTIYSYSLGIVLDPIISVGSTLWSTVTDSFNYVGSSIGLLEPAPPQPRVKRDVDSTESAESSEPVDSAESIDSAEPTDSSESTEVDTVQSSNNNISYNSALFIPMQFFQIIYQYLISSFSLLFSGTSGSPDSGNQSSINVEINDSSSGTGIELNASGNHDEFMDYLADISQKIAIRISARLWDVVKNNLLPLIDSAIIEFKDTDMFSDEIKQMLDSYHAAYQMAHTLNII